jgi:hypothetical protein
MGLLIHYCTTSGKETIIRPSKHKTADAARDSAEDLRKTMRGQGGADKWRPDGTDRWINDKGDVVKLTEDKPGEAKWTHYDEDGQVAGSGNSESSLFATLGRIRSAKRGQARFATDAAEDKKTSYFSANTTEQGADAHKKARAFIAEKEGDGFIAYESTYGNHGFSVTYWKKESKTADVMAGVTPSGHRFQGTGLRCDRCGRPRSAHFVAGEKEVEKTGDAETAASAFKTGAPPPASDFAGRLKWLRDNGFEQAAKEYEATKPKTTDSALDLGYPVNREWVRLSDAMSPADAAKELVAKFTPEQMDAWRANY